MNINNKNSNLECLLNNLFLDICSYTSMEINDGTQGSAVNIPIQINGGTECYKTGDNIMQLQFSKQLCALESYLGLSETPNRKATVDGSTEVVGHTAGSSP